MHSHFKRWPAAALFLVCAATSIVQAAAPGYTANNLALGKTITPLTGTVQGVPSYVTDGLYNVWYSYTTAGGGVYTNAFTIDLGASYSIGKINAVTAQTSAITISSSNDGVNWTVRHTYDWTTATGITTPTMGVPVVLTPNGAYSARYFKYEGKAYWIQYVGILEFEVYEWPGSTSEPSLSGLANLALGKTAANNTGYTSVAGHDPSALTDGNSNTYYQGNYGYDSCQSIYNASLCPTGKWYVSQGVFNMDLGSAQSIQAVRFTFPAGVPGSQGLLVYASDSTAAAPIKWWGTFGDPTMFGSKPTVTSSTTQTFYLPAPVSARYLWFLLQNWTTLGVVPVGLTEVEVFGALPTTPAVLSTPTPATAISTPSTTFGWSTLVGADGYWLDIGTSAGAGNLCASGVLTTGNFTCNSIPSTPGTTVHAQLYTRVGGAWQSPNRYTYTVAGPVGQITSPTAGSAVAGTAHFGWSADPSADAYWLDIGTQLGQGNVCASGVLPPSTLSFSCPGIPSTATTIYAQLWVRVAGVWKTPNRVTYLGPGSSTAVVAAVLTAPASGSVLTGATVTFTWSAGTGLDAYWLDVGSALGQGSISSGLLTSTSKVVSGLPIDRRTIYVRLWSHQLGANWLTPPVDYTFTAAADNLAALVIPGSAGTLSGSVVTFAWKNGAGADGYWLDVGPAVGSGAYSSGFQTNLARTVTGLPCNGSPVYVRLWTRAAGAYQTPVDYTFTAASSCGTDPRATLTTPALGSTLAGSSVTFTWNPGTGATQYWLDVGSSLGSGNYSAGATTALSRTVNSLPLTGGLVYVRLWTFTSGNWTLLDYIFLASAGSGQAMITSPTPGSAISGTTATFTWSAGGSGTDGYWLDVGTAAGQGNLSNGFVTANSKTVNTLPGTGTGTIYVRLWTRFNGSWATPIDYTFTN